MIGWREARRRRVEVPPAKIATGSVPTHFVEPRSAPRLRVKRGRITGDWIWRVLDSDNNWVTFGRAATHAEALAVGLAALETASVQVTA